MWGREEGEERELGGGGGDLRRSSKKERNIKDFLRISYS